MAPPTKMVDRGRALGATRVRRRVRRRRLLPRLRGQGGGPRRSAREEPRASRREQARRLGLAAHVRRTERLVLAHPAERRRDRARRPRHRIGRLERAGQHNLDQTSHARRRPNCGGGNSSHWRPAAAPGRDHRRVHADQNQRDQRATPASGAWPYSNGDLANTRDAVGSTISSSTLSKLRQAWTLKLTGKLRTT